MFLKNGVDDVCALGRSGRTFLVKTTTHAERAKLGVLLEMSPNFIV